MLRKLIREVFESQNRLLSHSDMLKMGATGSLSRAYLKHIPVGKIVGLDPEPADWTDDNGDVHEFLPGQEIKSPIEVIQDGDQYLLQNGNHRVKQANVNGDHVILALVQPERLSENLQLADKLYFKTGVLGDEDRKKILSITNGDNYTKVVADAWGYMKLDSYNKRSLEKFYENLKSYNKNVFPIKDLININNVDGLHIAYIIDALDERRQILDYFKKLPSTASRNMREDIRKPRTDNELKRYREQFEYFMDFFSLLDNKSDDAKNKIYQKMFRNGADLDWLIDFAQDKQNLISEEGISREDIKKVIQEDNDLTLLYDQGTYMVVRVESLDGIQAIGCNSLWCFTYGRNFRTWSEYSTNEMVYLIIDFTERLNPTDFMHVVIKPIDFDAEWDEEEGNEENEDKIYDLQNDPVFDAISFLENTIGLEKAKELLTFEW